MYETTSRLDEISLVENIFEYIYIPNPHLIIKSAFTARKSVEIRRFPEEYQDRGEESCANLLPTKQL